MKYALVTDSPLGKISLLSEDGKLFALDFGELAQQNPEDILFEAEEQLREYFAGKRTSFQLPLQMNGTAFQKDVWKALQQIPYGKCVSYADIARISGHGKAFQAVGSAVGKNPIPIIVPCHRVVNSNGEIGGFSCGLDKKRALMDIENIAHKGVKIQIFSI